MKLFLFYSCLLAILFQAISASSFDGSDATLTSITLGPIKPKKLADKSVKKKKRLGGKGVAKKSAKVVDGETVKKAVNKSGWRKKPSRAKKEAVVEKPLEEGEAGKGKEIVAEEDKPKFLSEILPEVLMKIIIGYFLNDDTHYPILVSTNDWLLQNEPRIAVDGARVYVITKSKGLKCLDHSSASLKENDRCRIEFGDSQWIDYRNFSSSRDGRYVSFGYWYEALTDHEKRNIYSTKWLTQGSELEDGRFKPVAFDGKDYLFWGWLSRDGQTLFYCRTFTKATRVYQVKKEAGNNPVAVMKLKFGGIVRAVSGNGNRVMVESNAGKLEIHTIGKDASDLVCRIDVSIRFGSFALNEDGSEAAFVSDTVLRVMKVDRVVGDSVMQPEIVTANGPKGLGRIARLVYSDSGMLHVLHYGGSISLFDPLTKALTPIEVLEKGQKIISAAISPDTDYIAILQRAGEEEKGGGNRLYKVIVKQRFGNVESMNVFGYVADAIAKRF